MTKYLVDLGMFYQPKNKLQKAIQGFIREQQRKVFSKDYFLTYKQYLREGVEKLNADYPKCTPIKINFWSGEKDEHLQLEGVVSLSLLRFEDR